VEGACGPASSEDDRADATGILLLGSVAGFRGGTLAGPEPAPVPRSRHLIAEPGQSVLRERRKWSGEGKGVLAAFPLHAAAQIGSAAGSAQSIDTQLVAQLHATLIHTNPRPSGSVSPRICPCHMGYQLFLALHLQGF
jgi:hypothetical protein